MLRDTFEELHKQGVLEFGWAWYQTNETIVHTAIKYGLDYQAHKTALSAIALALLRKQKSEAKQEQLALWRNGATQAPYGATSE
jgi:hypothetical protein